MDLAVSGLGSLCCGFAMGRFCESSYCSIEPSIKKVFDLIVSFQQSTNPFSCLGTRSQIDPVILGQLDITRKIHGCIVGILVTSGIMWSNLSKEQELEISTIRGSVSGIALATLIGKLFSSTKNQNQNLSIFHTVIAYSTALIAGAASGAVGNLGARLLKKVISKDTIQPTPAAPDKPEAAK